MNSSKMAKTLCPIGAVVLVLLVGLFLNLRAEAHARHNPQAATDHQSFEGFIGPALDGGIGDLALRKHHLIHNKTFYEMGWPRIGEVVSRWGQPKPLTTLTPLMKQPDDDTGALQQSATDNNLSNLDNMASNNNYYYQKHISNKQSHINPDRRFQNYNQHQHQLQYQLQNENWHPHNNKRNRQQQQQLLLTNDVTAINQNYRTTTYSARKHKTGQAPAQNYRPYAEKPDNNGREQQAMTSRQLATTTSSSSIKFLPKHQSGSMENLNGKQQQKFLKQQAKLRQVTSVQRGSPTTSSATDLQTAAGHQHHESHGHDHYHQYAEVPKKKSWKFGYKRGNHKHTITRHEEGHKNKFHTHVSWKAKEKCKKKKKKMCKSHGDMSWEYKHHDKKKKKKHHHYA